MNLSAELERTLEALLFLSPEPVAADALADAAEVELHEVVAALERLREHYEFERRGLVLRELAGGWSLSSHPEAEDAAQATARAAAHAGADAGAGRDAGDRRLPAAGLASGDRAHPRRQRRVGRRHAARARARRGVRPLAVRRRAVPHDRPVPAAVRAERARRAAADQRLRPLAGARGRLRELRAGR